MYFVNVDRQERKCTIHRADCRHVSLRGDKPLSETSRAGSWFEFANEAEAERFFRECVQTYDIERKK